MLAPAGAYCEAGHGTHAAEDVDPTADEAVPAGQAWHALSDWPGAEL